MASEENGDLSRIKTEWKWLTETVRQNQGDIKDLKHDAYETQIKLTKIEGNTEIIKGWIEAQSTMRKQVSAEDRKGFWLMITGLIGGLVTILTAIVAGIFAILR